MFVLDIFSIRIRIRIPIIYVPALSSPYALSRPCPLAAVHLDMQHALVTRRYTRRHTHPHTFCDLSNFPLELKKNDLCDYNAKFEESASNFSSLTTNTFNTIQKLEWNNFNKIQLNWEKQTKQFEPVRTQCLCQGKFLERCISWLPSLIKNKKCLSTNLLKSSQNLPWLLTTVQLKFPENKGRQRMWIEKQRICVHKNGDGSEPMHDVT